MLHQEHPLPAYSRTDGVCYSRFDIPEGWRRDVRISQWAANKAEARGYDLSRAEKVRLWKQPPSRYVADFHNETVPIIDPAPGSARYGVVDCWVWFLDGDGNPIVVVAHPDWIDQSVVRVHREGLEPRLGTVLALHYGDHEGRLSGLEIVLGWHKRHGLRTAIVHPDSALPETQAAVADLFGVAS